MIYQVNIPILQRLRGLSGTGNFELVEDLGSYVTSFISLGLTLASIAALGYLILGGATWIMAGEDKNKVDEARSRITNAIIGLAVVATSWAVFLLLDWFFGLGVAQR